MIVVIDGTGDGSDAVYRAEMKDSFCRQIAEKVKSSAPYYLRGPTLLGSQTSTLAQNAVTCAMKLQDRRMPVRLAGYSRGGCAAILAAVRLKERGIAVESLFLFDAVDMQLSEASLVQTIPDSVRFVAHARSARNLTFWAKHPYASRFYFYNTGRWLAGSGTLVEKSFVGTHAAVGGVLTSWPGIKEDVACARQVAAWMSTQLQAKGIRVRLEAIPPGPKGTA